MGTGDSRETVDGNMRATKEMAAFCLGVIAAELQHTTPPVCPEAIPNDPTPLFVTLRKLPKFELRGCLGSFSAEPLREQLRTYALGAAFRDSRFDPLTAAELPSLTCSVSLLHSFERCEAWNDWELGMHGLRVEYEQRRATYLPSVATSQGWNHRQLVESLVEKSGYKGPCTDSVLKDMTFTRYQVSGASVSYRDVFAA